ncbi:corticotropin-releasing factor-binding protein [Planococcus citri]|uniref:corticotropin-releasing factor-binding protein n=1 Tax=Planococcus citri TaxID=170843 RepID=UPI0031F99896
MAFKSQMCTFFALLLFLFVLFSSSLNANPAVNRVSFSQKGNKLINDILNGYRNKRTSEHIITDCMTVTSEKGHYYYKATREMYELENAACGVYMMANPDEVIQIHFDYIDMPCENNEIVSFVDGWELNGSYFPNEQDYTKPMKERIREFCGKKRIKVVLESSQNAALVRYQIPKSGRGFSFYFTTRKNPTPCNILVDSNTNIYTLRNYGQRVNCSLLAMHPAKIQILSLTVGINTYEKTRYTETGTFHNCDQNGIADYVQIGGGSELGEYSVISDSICGIDSIPGDILDSIFCGVTKIRLVSSGTTNNLITLTIGKVNAEENTESGVLCPSLSSE